MYTPAHHIPSPLPQHQKSLSQLTSHTTGIFTSSKMASIKKQMPIIPTDVDDDSKVLMALSTPLASSYNDRIRPLLDAVDRLRQLKVMKEGIQLPTIVVVGDQSSGKSSVLESLAGISLPRAQGICTRVPLVMRLQDDPSKAVPELTLEYRGKAVATTEADITAAITAATDEIAGDGKGISNTPLTLLVKKKGVPDLTMVDLPGITRVPVHGQPEDVYEQISGIIMEYIAPKESIILNVLSATVDFPTCESIRMSQRVDKTGERTLAVVTKPDKMPEGLLEKVTADDVNIGLGYVCVRNRIGEETYEEARAKEADLFETHPLLSKIDKSIVGVPVLAQRLVQIQAASIARCLPDIVRKINEKLGNSMAELEKMPQHLTTMTDALVVFMRILGLTKDSLKKLLVRGEFEEFPDDVEMHATARMAEMLNRYSEDLPTISCGTGERFLLDVMRVLEECKGIGLPNFLPRTAFLDILKVQMKQISHTPSDFVVKVWSYIETVASRVIMEHSESYPQLQFTMRRAVQSIMDKMRRRSLEHVKELVGMETAADYTSNPDYAKTWGKLMEQQSQFMAAVEDVSKPKRLSLPLVGEVCVGHLRGKPAMAEQAFDMGMRLNAYGRCVKLRLVDGLALHLLYGVKKLMEVDLEKEVVEELVGKGNGISKMLEESPSTAGKRERLKRSIELLEQSKAIVANVMDRIAAGAD